MDYDKGEKRPMLTESDMVVLKVHIADWRRCLMDEEEFVESIRNDLENAMENSTGSRGLPERMERELDRMDLAVHGASAW